MTISSALPKNPLDAWYDRSNVYNDFHLFFLTCNKVSVGHLIDNEVAGLEYPMWLDRIHEKLWLYFLIFRLSYFISCDSTGFLTGLEKFSYNVCTMYTSFLVSLFLYDLRGQAGDSVPCTGKANDDPCSLPGRDQMSFSESLGTYRMRASVDELTE